MLAFLALLASAEAGELKGFGEGATDAFTVLDVNFTTGFAAVKVVSHVEDWSPDGPPGSVGCNYAGMSATPNSGVSIATWNLATGQFEPFVVYALATEASECSAEATNQQNLAAAKAKASSHGLDVTKKPALVAAKDEKVTIGGKTVSLAVETTDNDEEMTRTAKAVLSANSKAIWEGETTFNPSGAGHVNVHLVGAVANGTKAVLILSVTEGNMRSQDSTAYVLTPIVDLK